MVVGNEANGIPKEWLRDADDYMTIPMPGKAESLMLLWQVLLACILHLANKIRTLQNKKLFFQKESYMATEHKLSLPTAILININIMMGAGIFINTVELSKRAGLLGGFMYPLIGLLILPLIIAIASID